jgi:hypothetical protein
MTIVYLLLELDNETVAIIIDILVDHSEIFSEGISDEAFENLPTPVIDVDIEITQVSRPEDKGYDEPDAPTTEITGGQGVGADADAGSESGYDSEQ